MNSLTAGPSEDPSIYRVTIGLTGDDRTFEQIKKQLNRSVEVIKVMDFTGIPVHLKELMFLRISGCSQQDMTELFRLSQVLGTLVIDYGPSAALLQSVQTERKMTIWYPCFSPSSPDGSKLCAAGAWGWRRSAFAENKASGAKDKKERRKQLLPPTFIFSFVFYNSPGFL